MRLGLAVLAGVSLAALAPVTCLAKTRVAAPAPALQPVQVEPVLADALLTAVAGDPGVAAAKAEVRASGADLSAARWLRFPSVSVEGLLLTQPGHPRQVQVVVDEPIWNAGRVNSAVRGASARQQAAIAALDQTTQSVALAVAETYYTKSL